MKTPIHPRPSKLFGTVSGLKRPTLFGLVLSLTALPSIGFASLWTGGAADNNWDNLSNWDSNPSGGAANVQTLTAYPIITANNTLVPNDVNIANATGTTGRIDVRSGTLTFNYWSFIGDWNGNGTLNIADTTTTGGTFTGFGLGSGSYVSANAAGNANMQVGLYQSTGVVNMNTTGHLDVQNLNISPNGQAGSGTFNLDNGTVNVSAALQVGSDFYGQGTTSYGYLNMSGGTATANLVVLSRGDNNTADIKGAINMTGGTLNSKTWFTLGFAGASTAFAGVTNSGGTINVNTAGTGNMEMCVWDPMSSYFELNSGALNLCNGAYITYGNGGNHSGTSTITQNGGTVTFYSDNGTTVGGTGYLRLGTGSDTGTYAYNLNGGTLTVPSIQRTATGGSGTFNFNGGTLKPTASTATFLQGLTAANIRSGGAKIDTAGKNITINQSLINNGVDQDGGLTKTGNGTLTLGNSYTYTNTTKVIGGTLVVNSGYAPYNAGSLVVSNAALKVIASGAMPAASLTLDNNSALTADFGSVFSLPTSPAINASGSITKGTNITINVSISGPGVGPGPIPLITVGSGSITTNNFVIGSLPAGVQGVLSNDTTTLYFHITSAGQLLSWRGTQDGSTPAINWDVNTTTNWYDSLFNPAKYIQYAGNTIGDNVEFGGNGYAYDGTNHVNVTTSVVPATVVFNTSTPYILTGTGSISGATSLVFTNSANVIIETTNNYAGGTLIGADSALTINNGGAVGAGVVTLDGTLRFNANAASSQAVSVSSASKIGADAGVSATLGGVISGSGTLTKNDNGTLTLAGNNTFAGPTYVSAGTLNVSGSVTNSSVVVGNIAGNATLGVSGNLSVNNFFIGNTSGAHAAARQTAGTLTTGGGTGDSLNVGNASGSYGYFDAAGGTMNVNGIAIGGEENPNVWPPQGSGDGIMEVHGGTVNNDGWIVLARGGGPNTGVLNMFGGSLLTYAGGGIGCNWNGNASPSTGAQISIINVMGGLLASTNQGLEFRSAGNTGVLNLNGGMFKGTAITGSGVLNFNGGALQPAVSTGNFINVTRASIYGGGATIDDGGLAVTVAQPLLAPEGYGVSSISLTDGGSGYIAPPIVTISGGMGSNATAIATVSGGIVTGITVTSPGNGYDVTDSGSISLSFTGGGSTAIQPTVGSVSLAANTSGGLIKKGAGTLTLNGANTYTGVTIVTNGTLVLTPAQQTATPVVVADGAKLSIATSSTTNGAIIGNLTLGSVSAGTLGVSYGFAGNPTNVALTAGAVTVNGSSIIKIGGIFDVGVFPLLKYTSLSTVPALEAPRGTTATLTNDTVNKILYVKVTAVGGGIVWDGTTGLITNKWDINVTTNWLTGATPTTYQEVTPPGDAVTFNDAGSPSVRVSNTVSPAKVVISNSVANYTFGGTGGQINSTLGLSKVGAGSVTLNVPGTYSGSTVVSNGTISLGAAQTFANLSGNGTISGGSALTVTTSSNTVFAGKLQGTLTLTKNGNGTLTLASNYTAAAMSVNAGKIVLASSNTVNGDMFIGNGSGITGALDITSGGFVNMPSTWFFVGRANGTGTLNVTGNGSINAMRLWAGGAAYGDNGIGTVNIDTTGTITGTDGIMIGEAWSGGYGNGTLNLTNGTVVSGNEFWVGGDCQTGSTNYGTVNQYGGSVSCSAWMAIGRSGNGGTVFGTYNLFGGTVTAATSTSGSFLTIGSLAGGTGVMNVSGGSLLIGSSRRVYVGEGGTGTLNVSGTGVVTCSNAVATDGFQLGLNGGSAGTVNLDGGKIRAAYIRQGSGTGTWNFNGGTLEAVAGNTSFMSGLTAAYVRTGGAVIDSAGNNITIAQALLNNGADQDGGLTKNGNGTLLLNGVNTYTNVTTVNAGTLGGTGTIAGNVVVASGGTLTAGASVGTLTINGNLTLAGNLAVEVDTTLSPAQSNDVLAVTGTATYTGTGKTVIVTNIGAAALVVGDTFKLFNGTLANGNLLTISGPAGVTWTNELATLGQIRVLSVAPPINPNPPVVQVSVSGSTMTLAWPTNAGWILQSNSVSLSSPGAWFNYPADGSVGVTSVNITMDPAKTNVFYRMVKP